ncbi:MAG: nucleotidyltransferase domain-containing protein [Candidatus Wallbacteria bacterium]|nr:nucleotidyltransferase domain-containing protein [Candidatus Wallbacteria bacterium]
MGLEKAMLNGEKTGWPDFGITVKEAGTLRNIRFDRNEQAMLDDISQILKNIYQTRLLGIRLVGSRARGTHQPLSDWDFLVLLDQCDYSVEVPKLTDLCYEMTLKHGLGAFSFSPLSKEQFLGLDKKYPNICEEFRRDAIII